MSALKRIVVAARRMDPLAALVLTLIGLYAVLGIGSPLLGLTVFAGTDLLSGVSPYRDAGLHDTTVQNTYLNDTVDAYLPNTALFVSSLHSGEYAAWNPYIIGGTPLGAAPNLGLLNPIAWPYLLLPTWLAPAYVKLVEIAVAAGGTFLFVRRVGLGRPAALLAGLIFASSGFMVAWTNWPHTRVAALIPALFWALERLVVRRRLGDGVLVAVVVAAMLFGGFPAVAGYGLLFGAVYLAVRVLASYRGDWRRVIGIGAGALGAVLAGAALTAVQVLPFLSYMSAAKVEGRQQSASDHLLPESLVTTVAPWALGSTDPSRPPSWYLHVNLVESLAYVGAAAMVLVVVALALPRLGRVSVARGVWAYFVGAAGTLLVVLYVGRLPLAVLQHLPVLFSENFVGRARSVLGFLLAVLAGVGFQLLLERRRSASAGPLWYGVSVWLGAVAVGALAWWDARRAAYQTAEGEPAVAAERVGHLNQEMLIAAALVLLAAGAAAVLWWAKAPSRGRTHRASRRLREPAAGQQPATGPVTTAARRARAARWAAAALLPALVAGQALSLAAPYWPKSERETFYPMTDTHRFLAENLDHERFAGSGGGMYVGADSAHRLRALTGHFFLNGRFAETVDGLPGRQFGDPPTYVNFPATRQFAAHPVLDRLAVKYFVAAPGAAVIGKAEPARGDGPTVRLRPGQSVTVPAPGAGPLRAIGLTPAEVPAESGARVEAVLLDSRGSQVARADRLLYWLQRDKPFWIALPAEHVRRNEPLSVRLTLRADRPLSVRGDEDAPALSTVRPDDDGLRLAYSGSTVIYERLRALPRVRWASHARVEPEAARRVALVASGRLARDEVVLDAPSGSGAGAGAAGGGGHAEVKVRKDGADEIEVSVTADGAGHLVIADALQQDWGATVDGKPAELVPADHGLVAVPVARGTHTVRLAYRPPYHNLGAWISGFSGLLLSILLGIELFRRNPEKE